jgi:L-threonylcarbamoyladenylate synthase
MDAKIRTMLKVPAIAPSASSFFLMSVKSPMTRYTKISRCHTILDFGFWIGKRLQLEGFANPSVTSIIQVGITESCGLDISMPQVSIDALAAAVRAGTHLASFPTDTVPALASRPDRADLIYAAKQRSLDKPLILMASDSDELWNYVTGTEAEFALWKDVAHRYWPGALTLVLPANDRVPAAMNPKDPTTIGVRVPDHAIARTILAKTGALATTSANRSGQPALLTMPAIEAEFPDVLTLFPSEYQNVTITASGTPSTVLKWTSNGWNVLRQGNIQLKLEL